MKNFANHISIYFSKHWNSALIRMLLFVVGVFVSSFGLALYQQPSVGGSQIDWTLYNVVSVFIAPNANGTMTANAMENYYPYFLAGLYVILILFAILFSLKPTLKEFGLTKNKLIWISFSWMIISDILITIIVPLIVGLFITLLVPLNLASNESIAIRNWAFIGGFICFVVGIGLWVKADIILGPFNNICTQFIKLTMWNYSAGRLVIDIVIFASGFVFFPFIMSDNKLDFLLTNFGLGTMCFTFLVGPMVNYLLKFLNKLIDFDKIDKIENSPLTEIKEVN